MTIYDCKKHGQCRCRRKRLCLRFLKAIIAFILLVLLIILIVWLVLRPTKPKFYLSDATVISFNLTSTSSPTCLLSSSIQVSITSRNPNDRIGVRYDKLDVFATYRYQQITLSTALPPTYQGHNDITTWSPFVYGPSVPLPPYLSNALVQDENAGALMIHVKIDGRLRWKVGTWTSGHYHIHVRCPAILSVNGGWSSVRFMRVTTCNVDIDI
ncbi:hypothetical protein QJS10_CPA02g01054 [Acorus calamus]|uniref:Late embryogenesis abundant protein LEA-2 subgroup domain-containing protein n=1 Tax=Acorus calamus TaxID=4465 RepID=A0AAV9F9V5_ACOCL|nr:hypothetical protein QJS10_CPA02g01054 [Acorus calamus]